MYMQGLANFIDDFLGGLILIGYALVVGSLLWSAFILKVWSDHPVAGKAIVRRAVAVLAAAMKEDEQRTRYAVAVAGRQVLVVAGRRVRCLAQRPRHQPVR